MTKKRYTEILKSLLFDEAMKTKNKGKSTEELTLELIHELKGYLVETETTIKDKSVTCNTCGCILPKKTKFKADTEVTTGIECVYRDSGYGDDDQFATVKRTTLYNICPKCGKHFSKISTWSEEISERTSRT